MLSILQVAEMWISSSGTVWSVFWLVYDPYHLYTHTSIQGRKSSCWSWFQTVYS